MSEPPGSDLQRQLELYRSRLSLLIRQGVAIGGALAAGPGNGEPLGRARTWQQEAGVTVNELSGGSKGHWLARAFSEAFLVRSSQAAAVESVPPEEIIKRLVGVLEQALASLSRDDAGLSFQAPAPHRFDFIHDPELRPVLEQAYADARRASDQGDYADALLGYASILESIVTHALQEKKKCGFQNAAPFDDEISNLAFEKRLLIAENAGLIGRGYARLPKPARDYRELDEQSRSAITERDARVTGQVLSVIMRDLNPGR